MFDVTTPTACSPSFFPRLGARFTVAAWPLSRRHRQLREIDMFTTQYSSALGNLGTLGHYGATAPAARGPRRKWPFQSSQPVRPAADVALPQADVALPQHETAAQHAGSGADSSAAGTQAKPSLRVMIVDTAMVLVWAALIPGLMWLGQAGGF